MVIKINVAEDLITEETEYTVDAYGEGKRFPVVTVGRNSYVEEANSHAVFDTDEVYSVQIGRYSALAAGIEFIVDLNHDYKKVSQGRIQGATYQRPTLTKRKGQIIIMNDCWIGQNATIMSGVTIGNGAIVSAEAVVTRDVPSYAIVAGNPAKVIGYRFTEEQIEKLNLIRWWNWSSEKVLENASLLYGDVDEFINRHISEAIEEIKNIPYVDIKPIPKNNLGEEKILLYIPDFEQDYPTYPRVLRSFIEAYADTNHELLLYIREDQLLDEKLAILNDIFEDYDEVNTYVNLFIGNVEDERALFAQVDGYITNRDKDNVLHIDMADMFGIQCISGVDKPIFINDQMRHMVRIRENDTILENSKRIHNLEDMVKKISNAINNQSETIHQISLNQVGIDGAIDNLKYEIVAVKDSLQYPIIKDGEEAIDLIIKEGKSLCRFGDGEFAVIQGHDRQKFQRPDERLAVRLNEVLHQTNDKVLVAIANNYGDLTKYNSDARYNIRAYMMEKTRQGHYELLDFNRTYYDAYLTRPYAMYADKDTDAPSRRFQKLSGIWEGKKLLIIEGEKTRMGVGNDLFDNAADIIRILGPAEHAFDRYDDILSKALEQEKDRLVLIAMGATATVLAYDLTLAGFQALDIGHIDLEYEWMLAGLGHRTNVAHKYNNEVVGGDVVADIHDEKYESQIIARIY